MFKIAAHRCLQVTLLMFAGFSSLATFPAHAWGSAGHRVTAEIAEALLTPTVRARVTQLLGNESLAEAAVYMDTHREALQAQWPQSPRWHYDNREVCNSAGNDKYCRDGHCASAQLARFQQVLANPRTPYAERRMALRLLIHMLGDIHQPLHMTDNADRGGNDLYVRLYAGAQRRRLHEVFDTQLVRELMGRQRDQAYADYLRQRYRAQLTRWQQGTLSQWLDETHQLGVKDVYATLPGFACHRNAATTVTLPPAYLSRAREYLPEQLTKAGVRIARILNQSLQ